MRKFQKLLIIILSFILIFAWEQTFFANFYFEELVSLLIIYIIIAIKKKRFDFIFGKGDNIWGVFIVNTVIFIIILATGGINSPIFFLSYLLFLGMGFIVEPFIIIVFLIGAIFIFSPQILLNDVQSNFLRLGSLLLITPLAFILSRNEFSNFTKKKKD